MIEITGLWKGQTKTGEPYYSGMMGKVKFFIFKNTKKQEGDNQPDLRLCIDEAKKRKEGGSYDG
jgi:hypothetical protein